MTRVELFVQPRSLHLPWLPAVHHGLAYVFAARDANTEGFLWRTLTGEQRQIMNEMHLFSRGETLAAIQAMVIYTIMRLIDSGREYFAAHRDMSLTMKVSQSRQLVPRHLQSCPLFYNPHTALSPGSPGSSVCRRWCDETVGGELGRGVDDTLDQSYAGLDGLGVMLAVVMADV